MPPRDNGLRASRYVPLIDLEPQLADAMLEALRVDGVAGYADAAPGVVGPFLDAHLPDHPKDRLWVDAEAVGQARRVLDAQLPVLREGHAASADAESNSEVDEDAAWEAIVAGYDLPGQPSPGRPEPRQQGEGRLLRRAEQAAEQAAPPELAEPADSAVPPADDHYVPPPPPPLPAADTVTKLAWAGVIGGPAFLLLATLTGRGLSEQTAVVAVIAFVVGFVTLVARMKDRPTDSGPDDGAVV